MPEIMPASGGHRKPQQGRSGKIESAKSGKRFSPEPVIETGVGSAGNRTRDLLHPKQESYH